MCLPTILLLFHPCRPNLPDKLVYLSYIRSVVHPFDLHDCWPASALILMKLKLKSSFFGKRNSKVCKVFLKKKKKKKCKVVAVLEYHTLDLPYEPIFL